MPKSAQKIKATTQKFTEIYDVIDDIVFLSSGNACQIIEITATNFALQSEEEQNVRILSYASFLNSLSFTVQIFIRSTKLDVSAYIKQLEEQMKQTLNPLFAKQIGLYKDFVADLVKVNTVLDKKFYIVVPHSPLESGVKGAKAGALGIKADPQTINQAKITLKPKSESVVTQVSRINLKARILGRDELIRLFYEIYNGPLASEVKLGDFKAPIVEAAKK